MVEVGFDQITSFVNESVGSYELCVFLRGLLERTVMLEVVSVPANSPGL